MTKAYAVCWLVTVLLDGDATDEHVGMVDAAVSREWKRRDLSGGSASPAEVADIKRAVAEDLAEDGLL